MTDIAAVVAAAANSRGIGFEGQLVRCVYVCVCGSSKCFIQCIVYVHITQEYFLLTDTSASL